MEKADREFSDYIKQLYAEVNSPENVESIFIKDIRTYLNCHHDLKRFRDYTLSEVLEMKGIKNRISDDFEHFISHASDENFQKLSDIQIYAAYVWIRIATADDGLYFYPHSRQEQRVNSIIEKHERSHGTDIDWLPF